MAGHTTDCIHADLHLSHDEIRDADDDMIAQKTLATQVIEDAEQHGQDGTVGESLSFTETGNTPDAWISRAPTLGNETSPQL